MALSIHSECALPSPPDHCHSPAYAFTSSQTHPEFMPLQTLRDKASRPQLVTILAQFEHRK